MITREDIVKGYEKGVVVFKNATFDSHGADSELACRDGQMVTAWPLEEEKYDRCETGPMYHVMFHDGFESDAFADELKWEKE